MAPSRGLDGSTPTQNFELPDEETSDSETPTLEQDQFISSSAASSNMADDDDAPLSIEPAGSSSEATGSDSEPEGPPLSKSAIFHHSSSSLLMSNTFAPPFYNRPPTPLPPSPSLTSLLRPSFSTTTSRHSSPEVSDVETPGDTESAVVKSARITDLPRAHPKVPTYEYYGFLVYIMSFFVFLLYLAWSYLPEAVLKGYIRVSYYPDRWWSLAIPAFLVMTIIYIYVALASYNTGYLTLPMNSIGNIVDEAASIAVVDGKGKMQNRRATGKRTHITLSSPDEMDWKSIWNEGTDAVMDVPVGGVCEILYGSRESWKLEIVSILAVLGESNIKIHAQTITASKVCLLPRLLPAPQALLRERRPKTLPYIEDVKVFGTRSGGKREGLNFAANLIHNIERCPAYCVQEVRISDGKVDHPITYLTLAPLNVLAMISCLLSIGLIIWSIIIHDGVALIALLLACFATSALGYASLWSLSDNGRRARRRAAEDKIVIQIRAGSFIVVSCPEHIGRRLYFAAEIANYELGSRSSQAFGGAAGGLMIMAAVVLFANCSWTMQAAIGFCYAVLNVAYWLMTAVPDVLAWDMSAFTVSIVSSIQAATYTDALWRAMYLAGSTTWVRDGLLPSAEAWKLWIDEAEDNLENEDWDAQEALHQVMEKKSV
ncbi:uncharacterized protein KY384_000114 [Bacidia gigantensis]|uniref:uncharacterized protein n=1 Tax=Bacidia gigantensis TaxID=2732470 RepID=UPI001D059DA2|nr:uncharacterized protein KY384_000114 [Bacidia gigantensis]KAG8526121.1 hypothetical protein KY384_000114 [Bacidia gigantensis]